MKKRIKLYFTYNNSNKSTYVQAAHNNEVKLSVNSKVSSLKYVNSGFILTSFLSSIKKNINDNAILKVLVLYNSHSISLSTLLKKIEKINKNSKLDSFKVLNEFSLESGFISPQEKSINFIKKLTN